MRLPHERWGLALCPRFCPFQKTFWLEWGKMCGETEKRGSWHSEFAPCELDETMPEARIVWQENFNFDMVPAMDAGDVHNLIEKWLRTTPFLGLGQLDFLESLEYPYDDYTRVEGVVVTDDVAQIFFSRPCPVFFARKFIETIGVASLGDLFSEHLKRVPQKVRFLVPPKKTHLTGRLEAVIAHLRQDPVDLGGVIPKEFFKGFLLPITEAAIQYDMFLAFMKEQFPDWRHVA